MLGLRGDLFEAEEAANKTKHDFDACFEVDGIAFSFPVVFVCKRKISIPEM